MQIDCQKVALSFGYSVDELSTIPDSANLGVSCGNPLALAGLKEGETVVDLGCGAGFDVFLAARKIGQSGMAIGVDMSKDMLARAHSNAAKSSITNVKFIESVITNINLPSNSANCVISNCVINLVPQEDKPLVFREIFGILKPGGRVAVSDILAKKTIPETLLKNMSLYVSCISGASQVEEYMSYLHDAGFSDILLVNKNNNLNVYKDNKLLLDTKASILDSQMTTRVPCCGQEEEQNLSAVNTSFDENTRLSDLDDIDFNDWVGSYDIYAVKQ